MRFLGEIEARTDTKGRAFLPASFRKELQKDGVEKLIMRLDVFSSCLVLYPESVWDIQMDEMRTKLDKWDRNEQALFRQFVRNIVILSLDNNGRFLIPERYRKLTKIEQDVHFVGMGNIIEIWSPCVLEAEMLSNEDFANGIEEKMTQNNTNNDNLSLAKND